MKWTVERLLKCLKSDCRGCERENYASCDVYAEAVEVLEKILLLKEYSKCYSNGDCKKCYFGSFDYGGGCINHAKMLLEELFEKSNTSRNIDPQTKIERVGE